MSIKPSAFDYRPAHVCLISENGPVMTSDAFETNAPPTTLPERDDLRRVASRVFWWLTPGEAMADRLRFAAQVMTMRTWDDVQTARSALGEQSFRQVLLAAPAGVFDARSWAYWHSYFGISPIPALPRRKLP